MATKISNGETTGIITSRQHKDNTFTGTVHYYENWQDGNEHPASFKRFLFIERTQVKRLTAKDAQKDAALLATEVII